MLDRGVPLLPFEASPGEAPVMSVLCLPHFPVPPPIPSLSLKAKLDTPSSGKRNNVKG
jgi:hypothetical protein